MKQLRWIGCCGANALYPVAVPVPPIPLAGLVVCGECQQRFGRTQVQPYRQPSQYAYLRPLHCPFSPKCRSIPYDAALAAVIAQIAKRYRPRSPQLCLPLPTFTTQMEAIDRQLQQLTELERQGLLDAERATAPL